MPVGFYGVLASGGTLVPIDPKSPVEQVVRILQDDGCDAPRLGAQDGATWFGVRSPPVQMCRT